VFLTSLLYDARLQTEVVKTVAIQAQCGLNADGWISSWYPVS